MFEGFTETARDLVILAQEEARVLRHGRIGSEHLVLGFLRVRPDVLTLALGKRKITLAAARQAVIRLAEAGSAAQTVSFVPYSAHARQVIESASALSRERGDEQVEPEHVLLALLGQADRGSGAGQVLGALRADLPDLRRQARRRLDDARADYLSAEPAVPRLSAGMRELPRRGGCGFACRNRWPAYQRPRWMHLPTGRDGGPPLPAGRLRRMPPGSWWCTSAEISAATG